MVKIYLIRYKIAICCYSWTSFTTFWLI